MSVNSTSTYLRQKLDSYRKKTMCVTRNDGVETIDKFSSDYLAGYEQCIRDFEDFGD